jgi:hypothetical protein
MPKQQQPYSHGPSPHHPTGQKHLLECWAGKAVDAGLVATMASSSLVPPLPQSREHSLLHKKEVDAHCSRPPQPRHR